MSIFFTYKLIQQIYEIINTFLTYKSYVLTINKYPHRLEQGD